MLFWTAILVVVAQALVDDRPRLWLLAGVLAGHRPQQQARRRLLPARRPRRRRPGPRDPAGPAHPLAVARPGCSPWRCGCPTWSGRRSTTGRSSTSPPTSPTSTAASAAGSGWCSQALVMFSPLIGVVWVLGLVRLLRRPDWVRAPAARDRLPGRARGLPGHRRQGLLPRRPDPAADRRRLHRPRRALVHPRRHDRRRRPGRLGRGRLPGGRPGGAGLDVRRLLLGGRERRPARHHRLARLHRPGPRRRRRPQPPTSGVPPSSSPATTARPARCPGTTSGCRSTAATTATGTGVRPRTTPRPVVVVLQGSPDADFEGCGSKDRLRNSDGVDNEEVGAGIWVCAGPRGSWSEAWKGSSTTTRDRRRRRARASTSRSFWVSVKVTSTVSNPLWRWALRVSGVGALVGIGQVDVVGERRQQRPRPQPALEHDVDLDAEHAHARRSSQMRPIRPRTSAKVWFMPLGLADDVGDVDGPDLLQARSRAARP